MLYVCCSYAANVTIDSMCTPAITDNHTTAHTPVNMFALLSVFVLVRVCIHAATTDTVTLRYTPMNNTT